MEKTDLLNILYNERQRLAAKYSSPGWNKWVLYAALISSALYFFDLRQKMPFNFIPVLIAFTLIFISTIDMNFIYLVLLKKEKLMPPNVKKKERIRRLAIISNIPIIIILWSISFSSIPKPILITSIDFQYATIIFAFAGAFYLCLTLNNHDLSNIDYLIDQTILDEHPDASNTLNIMQAIKLDYSLSSIYEKDIKFFISRKHIILQNKIKLESILEDEKKIHFSLDNPASMEHLSEKAKIRNLTLEDIEKQHSQLTHDTTLFLQRLNNTEKYIVNNKKKKEEMKLIRSLLQEEAMQQIQLIDECNNVLYKCSKIISAHIQQIESILTNNQVQINPQ